MRKSNDEAAETRRRIVRAAGAEFRKHGIGGTGLADLMKAAGLTHGGFYKHFESKDQLAAEAVAAAEAELIGALKDAGPGAVAAYLSARHRDDPGGGCPLAAIGSELGRAADPTRAAATDGFLKLVELVAGQVEGAAPAAARRRALAAAAAMIGAVTMARVVNDPALSAEILKEAKKGVAALIKGV